MLAWLSKTKVLVGLCLVMLLAALQHGDLMVYGIFLFLTSTLLLGLALPWWSMRGMHIDFEALGSDQAREGEACKLSAWVERRTALPACLIQVEAHWTWAGHRITQRMMLPWVAPGRRRLDFSATHWPARGHYQLSELTLACAFPLGLRRVQRRLALPAGPMVSVRPREAPVPVRLGDPAFEAPRGDALVRRHAAAGEAAALRPYEVGDDPRHMNWRASARAGELIIQRREAHAERRWRLIVVLPEASQIGQPEIPAEEAVRVAMTVLARAMEAGVRVELVLGVGDTVQTVDEPADCVRALSEAPARRIALATLAREALAGLRAGVQVVWVVPHDVPPQEFAAMLQATEAAHGFRDTLPVLATTGPGLEALAPGWPIWWRGAA